MNRPERLVRDDLAAGGCAVMVGGWPDFLCVGPAGAIFGLEVKGPGDDLREHQAQNHDLLRACGLPVHVAYVLPSDGVSIVHSEPQTTAAWRRERLEAIYHPVPT